VVIIVSVGVPCAANVPVRTIVLDQDHIKLPVGLKLIEGHTYSYYIDIEMASQAQGPRRSVNQLLGSCTLA